MTSIDFELDWFFPISPDDGYGTRTNSVGSQDGDIFNDQFINLFPSVADVAKKNGKVDELDALCNLGYHNTTKELQKNNEAVSKEGRNQEVEFFCGRKRSASEPFEVAGKPRKNEEWVSEYLSEPKSISTQPQCVKNPEGQSDFVRKIETLRRDVSPKLLVNFPVLLDPVKVVIGKESQKSAINSEAHDNSADREIENVKDETEIRRIGTLPCQTSFSVTQQQIAKLLAEDTTADFHAKNKVALQEIQSDQFESKPESIRTAHSYFRSKSFTLPPVKDNVTSTGSPKQDSGFSFLRRALTQEKRAEVEAVSKPGGKVIIERREEPLFPGLQLRKAIPLQAQVRQPPKRARDNEKRRNRKIRGNTRRKHSEVPKADPAPTMLHPVNESDLQKMSDTKKAEPPKILSTLPVGVPEVKLNREIVTTVAESQQNSEFDLLFDVTTPISLPSESNQLLVRSSDVTYAPLLPVNEAEKYPSFQELVVPDFLNAGTVNEPFLEQILSNLLKEVVPAKSECEPLKTDMNDMSHDSLSDLLLLDNVFQSHCNGSFASIKSAKIENSLVPSPDKSEFALSPNMYSDVSSDGIANSFDINENSYLENNNNTTLSPSPKNGLRHDNGSDNVENRNRSNHVCRYCGKVFKDKYSVTVHVRVHSGEKPFPCSLCNKPFRQKAHLAKHFLTHTNPNGRKRKRELKLLEGEKMQKKRKKPAVDNFM